jgi:guanylate kinase
MLAHDDRHRLATDTDDGLLLVISGPSGVGKTTITRGVERSIADSIFSVSLTTRPKTEKDVEGVDYHFVTRPEFEQVEKQGGLLESATVYGNRYGTPRSWVTEQLERGRVVILEIDVEGARQVKAKLPDAFCLFILPPDEPTLLERLRGRKREDETVIQRRFAQAQSEIAAAKDAGIYDVFVVNDDLDRAIAEAADAVRQRRRRA